MQMSEKIVLERNKIYYGNLLLVNADFPLKEEMESGFVPADSLFPKILMSHDAANALRHILKKIASENLIVPVSGYRSLKEQTAIYRDSLKENGEEFTKKYVALPNHSEHQTGLAIDLGLNLKKIDFIRPAFPYEGICGSFRREAPNYGFVERYTKEKEAVTGIAQEPWHFRYVGYPHSKIMAERGLSLEEYTEFIKAYREGNRLIYRRDKGAGIEIYYVPAEGEQTRITMPEKEIYQISGNNLDGFVVTIWKKRNSNLEGIAEQQFGGKTDERQRKILYGH
ncbi:MAG: M15 family metallopeptidase [Clostridium sp.]|nr:M15 family metallopeptidase [Clostridium sp.]